MRETMFLVTKMNRCMKSPYALVSVLIWILYLVYIEQKRHKALVMANKRQRANITKYVASSTLEREIEKSCLLREPTENDIFILKGGVGEPWNSASSDNRLVCEVIRMCDRFSFSVQCRSSDCDRFRVDFNLNRKHRQSITMDDLEKIIFDQIYSDRVKGNLQSKVRVLCESSYMASVVVPYTLNLEVLYSESKFCHDNGLPAQNSFQSDKPRQLDVRIFYFRHCSRYEFISKFTTFSSVHLSLINEKVEVVDFKRVQAKDWKGSRNLKMFLYGEDKEKQSEWISDDLCLNFFDFVCNMTNERKKVMKNFSKSNQGYCRRVVSLVSQEEMAVKSIQTYCKKRAEFTSKKNAKISHYYGFYSAFSMAHVSNTFDKPMITTSIVDLEDVRLSQRSHMDKALSNIVSELLAKQDSIIVLLSDAGKPPKNHLTSNQFFQTQSSNPFLYFLIPKRLRSSLGEDVISILKLNSNRLTSPLDVPVTLKDILDKTRKEKDQEEETEWHEKTGKNPKLGVSLLNPNMPSRSCLDFDIQPPGLCICENTFISYPNDSIQVAFAEYFVGVLNNQLQQKHSSNDSRVFCNNLSGSSFSNVRIGRWREKRLVLLDINLSVDKKGTLYVLKDVRLEVQSYPSLNSLSLSISKEDEHYQSNLKYLEQICCLTNPVKSRSYNYYFKYANLKGFEVEPDITDLHGKCLILITRNYVNSVTYLIGNFCRERSYIFTFDIEMVNMVSTVKLPIKRDLLPGEIKYLTSVVKSSYNIDFYSHKYKYDMNYKIFDEK